MIYLFGDIHGYENLIKFNKKTFRHGVNLTKNDYVIILGDFGVPWYNRELDENRYTHEQRVLDIFDRKPWTTLFVDGNHENFDILNNLESVPMFDSTVGKLRNSIFHLRRGHIYNIDYHKFLTFGGAASIDKYRRELKVSWWKEEEATEEEMALAIENLNNHNSEVDYVLSHTCSYGLIEKIANIKREFLYPDKCSKFFSHLEDKIKYKKWFFGHLHLDYVSPDTKYVCLFDCYYELNSALRYSIIY